MFSPSLTFIEILWLPEDALFLRFTRRNVHHSQIYFLLFYICDHFSYQMSFFPHWTVFLPLPLSFAHWKTAIKYSLTLIIYRKETRSLSCLFYVLTHASVNRAGIYPNTAANSPLQTCCKYKIVLHLQFSQQILWGMTLDQRLWILYWTWNHFIRNLFKSNF